MAARRERKDFNTDEFSASLAAVTARESRAWNVLKVSIGFNVVYALYAFKDYY